MERMGTGIVAETILILYGWVSRTVEWQRAFGERGRGKGAIESTESIGKNFFAETVVDKCES